MSYPRLATRLYNVPLLLSPDKAEVLERVFRSHVDGTAASLPPFNAEPRQQMDMVAAGGATQTKAGYLRTSDGIAVIQVVGSLVQRGSGMDAMSGLESYDNIGGQLHAALNDPMVGGILLEIDSAGGEVPGLFDLGAQFRAAEAVMPVTAHANEQAFSGAYALGVSAGEFTVARTGMVGSVGVRMMHVDQSSYDAKRGLVYTDIFAGARKNDFTPHEPLSDTALAAAQESVDRIYETFVAHVADMRGIDPQVVRDTEAALLHPDQALALGMVDGIGTINDALQSLRQRVGARLLERNNPFHNRAAGAFPKESIMANESKAPATTTAAPSTEQLAAERAAGVTEGQAGVAAQVSKAEATGAAGERARVAGILTHAEAAGRGKLAEHLAFKTSTNIEDAAALLAAAPKEAVAAPANPLAAAMAAVPNPKVGADAAGGDEAETAQSVAARVLAAGKGTKLKAVK